MYHIACDPERFGAIEETDIELDDGGADEEDSRDP